MFNCSASLEWDNSCNEDDKGDGEDGKEDGKDDVGLPLNLLRSRHLPNCGVAQHENKLETGRGNMILEDSEDYQKPDEEGGEEASADPNVKDCGITKLGDVSTDPVVQQKHIEDAEKEEDRCVQQGKYLRRARVPLASMDMTGK